MQDNKRDYKPFIVFAAIVVVFNVAALWFFLREDAPTPEHTAEASVSDDLTDLPDADTPNGVADNSAPPNGDSLDSDTEVANHAAGNGDVDEAATKEESEADDDNVSESQESCVFAALDVGLSSALVDKIEETNPRTLTDKQRGEWFKLLSSHSSVRSVCKDYWSEPVTAENADKRNEDYYSECIGDMPEGDYMDLGERGAQRVVRADTLELLERPYMDLTLADRMLLYSFFGYDQPFYNNYSVHRPCIYYYPQLFLGRWVPFPDE